jgi:hypothetical protein
VEPVTRTAFLLHFMHVDHIRVLTNVHAFQLTIAISVGFQQLLTALRHNVAALLNSGERYVGDSPCFLRLPISQADTD